MVLMKIVVLWSIYTQETLSQMGKPGLPEPGPAAENMGTGQDLTYLFINRYVLFFFVVCQVNKF